MPIPFGFMRPNPNIPSFKDGVNLGNLPFSIFAEISGLCRGQKPANAGYLWAIDDNTISPVKMLAINKATGASGGLWTLTSSTGVDIEDIAAATVGTQSYIYIGDIGDNTAVRTTVNIYRIKEPTITGSDGTLASGTDYETIVCNYPASPAGEGATARRDAETLLVDPDTGDMYVITKRTTLVQCFKLAHAASYSGTQTFTSMGNIFTIPTSVPANNANGGRATGGDISPDGSEILIKNYTTLYYWPRKKSTTSIYTALTATPSTLAGYVGGGLPSSHPNSEPQGEAICFDQGGRNIYTASEAVAAFGSTSTTYPLFRYDRLPATPTSISFQDGVNSYTGTSDTYIFASSTALTAQTIRGAEATFVVADNDLVTPNARYGLLKFDISSIPAKKTIVGVDLELFLNTEGQTIFVHKMLTAWTENSTYASGSGGTQLYTPARMPRLDGTDASSVEETHFGNYDTLVTGVGGVGNVKLKMPIATVQAWVDGTATNNGWLFYNTDGDGMQFRSKQATTAADRPKLTIRYI